MKRIFLGISILSFTAMVGFLSPLMTTVGYCQEPKAPIQLTITSDKSVYEVGELINIQFVFKNVSNDPIEFFIFEADFPLYHEFEFSDMTGNPIFYVSPEINFMKRSTQQEKILPGESLVSKVPLSKWKIAGLGHDYIGIGSEARKIIIKGIYFFPVGFNIAMKDGQKGFFGHLVSNPITIEVVEKSGPETSCVKDTDCWCAKFTGAKFVPGKDPGKCCLEKGPGCPEINKCAPCIYD